MIARKTKYDDDHHRELVTRFLASTYRRETRPLNWFIDRWINLRYSHYAEHDPHRPADWQSNIHVWESNDESGEIVGLILCEGSDLYAIQIHPDYRELESEMLIECERMHAVRKPADTANWLIVIESYAWDVQRSELLRSHDYERTRNHAWLRLRRFENPIESHVVLPQGYHIRAMKTTDRDKRRYVETLAAIFPHYRSRLESEHPDLTWSEQVALATQTTCGRMFATQYRSDLDLCIESDRDHGAFAAVCTFWLDDLNKLSIIEPMGVHPDHRKQELSRAIMIEGMRRSQACSAQSVITTSYDDAAHRAYEVVGLQPLEEVLLWKKSL